VAEASPRVFLVGAGPGDTGLLTMRALECLAQADLVIHDKLVPSRLLDFARAGAERLAVAQLPGCHADRGPQIQEAMIEAARQGKCVVRLKGGDPLLFGRGGEEAEALGRAGIPFEIVSGVTAALAAAACAGIPLTHRLHASAVALVTGHEDPSKPDNLLDWSALARFPGTLVFYMGIKRLAQIVGALLQQGKPPDTPAAAVHWAGTPEQRIIQACLAELPDRVHSAGLGAPAVVIIGSVVGLRTQLNWFDRRPLFGKRIVVTRPRGQAEELARRLERQGAAVHLWPVVAIADPADWEPADRALRSLASYDWLIFTSSNGVHALVRRLRHLGLDLRALGGVRLAAIGPATADALRDYHLEPDVIPEEYRSEALAQALVERVAGQRLLLARADQGREVLRKELAAVASIEQVAVYAQAPVAGFDADVLRLLREGAVDYVTLTSSNLARAFFRAVDDRTIERIKKRDIKLASISPVTSATIREWGLPIAAEARQYTTEGLVTAIVDSVTGQPG
jgi:uroporphyrinogen III methyltransferase / synthase